MSSIIAVAQSNEARCDHQAGSSGIGPIAERPPLVDRRLKATIGSEANSGLVPPLLRTRSV